jgi:hypothetical protein
MAVGGLTDIGCQLSCSASIMGLGAAKAMHEQPIVLMYAVCADGVLKQLYIHVQPSSFDSPHLLLLLLLLQSCVGESGIELPSPIQEAAMPQLLAGHNAAVQSYTGSGKVSSCCARTSFLSRVTNVSES